MYVSLVLLICEQIPLLTFFLLLAADMLHEILSVHYGSRTATSLSFYAPAII